MTRNILVLGDGNFSFSLALVKDRELFLKKYWQCNFDSLLASHESKDNDELCRKEDNKIEYFATSYDPVETLAQHENSRENIKALEEIGDVRVLHKVDAKNLHATFQRAANGTEGIVFSRVIFNFPHVGGKSNIKGCKGLLEDFFSSVIEFVDETGLVFVTLCKGQGGIPTDASRNGYGNSWQVATQAAKAGFVLCDVIPFESIAPLGYEPAGYRGNLHKGFLKKESLTHVFKKEKRIALPNFHNFKVGEELISEADDFLLNELKKWNPFKISWHPMLNSLSNVLCVFDNLYGGCHSDGTSLNSINSDFNIHVKSSANSDLLSFLNDQCQNTSLVSFGSLFIDSTTTISPWSYPVTPEIIIVDSCLKYHSLSEVATKVYVALENIFGNHHISLSLSEYSGPIMTNNPFHKQRVNADAFDLNKIPYFLEDINMEAWLSFRPELTISKEQKTNCDPQSNHGNDLQTHLKYYKAPLEEYNMSGREKDYFCLEGRQTFSFSACFATESPIYNIKINNIPVVSIGILKMKRDIHGSTIAEEKKHPTFLSIIRPDLLCMALLKINDIRLLWLEDKVFLQNLTYCMVNGSQTPVKVLYPLCYRHDLCFWVRGGESERALFAALRRCCLGLAHSVRLLRVLRHEESDLLSFCYRIIYSRCDGPLSHRETVELQNKLRLLLIDLNFDLR